MTTATMTTTPDLAQLFNEMVDQTGQKLIQGLRTQGSEAVKKIIAALKSSDFDGQDNAKQKIVNAVGDLDETPLMQAIRLNDAETVNSLIALGADVNAANIHGITPIMIALYRADVTIAQALIDANADINVISKHDITPTYLAESSGNPAILNVINYAKLRDSSYGSAARSMKSVLAL